MELNSDDNVAGSSWRHAAFTSRDLHESSKTVSREKEPIQLVARDMYSKSKGSNESRQRWNYSLKYRRGQNQNQHQERHESGQQPSFLQIDRNSNPDKDWSPTLNEEEEVESDDDYLDHEYEAQGVVHLDEKRNVGVVLDRRGFITELQEQQQPARFSSFIPPLPKKSLPKMIVADTEIKPESEQDTRARVRRKLKDTKFYKQPKSIIPEGPFFVEFCGITPMSFVMVKFNDYESESRYKHLRDNIKMYFSTGIGSHNMQMPFEEIDKGRIVLAQPEPGKYIRAWVLEVDTDLRTVMIKDCDEGQVATISGEKIYYILPMLMDTPFRIQKCKLEGLELWHNTQVLCEAVFLIKEVGGIMRVPRCRMDENDDIPVLTLQVTDNPNNEITINAMLRHIIAGFTRIPKTFVKGVILEKAHVTIAEINGEIWVQMHSAIASKLCALGEEPMKCSNHVSTSDDLASQFERLYFGSKQKRFLARFKDDRTYYRIEVVKAIGGSKSVKVRYLDFGNEELIDAEDILPLDAVDPILGDIPVQVFKGVLNGIDKIIDVDQFFEFFGVTIVQRFIVAGLLPSNVPLLDVYAKMNPNDPEEWTYVNEFIIDKGLAYGRVVSTPLACGSPKGTSPHLQRPDEEKKKHEQKRFYATCRIVNENSGVYAYLIKNRSINY